MGMNLPEKDWHVNLVVCTFVWMRMVVISTDDQENRTRKPRVESSSALTGLNIKTVCQPRA